jgi:hypothetical protein
MPSSFQEEPMDADVAALILPACFFGLYLILESADWGLCLAAPLVCRETTEYSKIAELMRPCLDGNEIWFLMSAYMLRAAVQVDGQNPFVCWEIAFTVLIFIGALLRMFLVLLAKRLGRYLPLFMKFLGLYSAVVLFGMGMLGPSLLLTDSSYVTLSGIFAGVWTVLGCLQIGALYGSWKLGYPLKERLRADCLVSCCLSAITYSAFVILIRYQVDVFWEETTYFWMSMVATTMLFLVSFFFIRSRRIVHGLFFAYSTSFFAIAVYFSIYLSVFPANHFIDILALKRAMDHVPAVAILTVALIWSVSTFIWRMKRKPGKKKKRKTAH